VTDSHEDAASLRRAFCAAAETFPGSVTAFLNRTDAGRREAQLLMAWWGKFYSSIIDHTAGLAVLAELQRAKELDALRRLELADTDAALASLSERYRVLRERLRKWQVEKGELDEVGEKDEAAA
jgi:glutathione S-transferase